MPSCVLFVVCDILRSDRLERNREKLAGLVGLVIGTVVDRVALDQVNSRLYSAVALAVCIWNTVIASVPSLIA